MPTANEDLFDAAIRHQIDVRRFTTGKVRELLALMEKADAELVDALRKRLPKLVASGYDAQSERWKALLADIRAKRTELMKDLQVALVADLKDMAVLSQQLEMRAQQKTLPVEIDFATVPAGTLRQLINEEPFQGHLLKDWFKGLNQDIQRKLQGALSQGLMQGESIDDIVRRIAGTRKNKYADGILSQSRAQVESITRTAVNHVSNSAREEFWNANADIMAGLRWSSTLDGRTTSVCQARDGLVAPVGSKPLSKGVEALVPSSARPPAHFNCRSIMVAYFDPAGIAEKIGDRPTVRDTRTGKDREIDFRQQAIDELQQRNPDWELIKDIPKDKLQAKIKSIRNTWTDENIGQVPKDTTYQQWLTRQPKVFQDDVLGQTKGKLFRDGDLKLTQFIDKQGVTLSLHELAQTNPAAFLAAGLKPEDF
jgi:SPP1 gp7 family putative phage head morphogenesis protein